MINMKVSKRPQKAERPRNIHYFVTTGARDGSLPCGALWLRVRPTRLFTNSFLHPFALRCDCEDKA